MLILFTLILCPIAFSVAGSLTFWKVVSGWDFYKPIILFFAGFGLLFLLWILLLYLFGKMINQKKEHIVPSKWAQLWLINCMQCAEFFAKVKTKMTGRELIPTKQRFLLVSNHRSNYDPIIAFSHFGYRELVYITKPSNFKIPLAHRFMWGMGFMGIEREDPLQSLEVVKKSIDKIQNEYASVAVYPEGTRHRDCQLGQFHEGMFNIALKSGCPIVVMTIVGTENITRNYPAKSTKVKLDVIKCIPYEDFQFKTAKEVSEEVRSMIEEHINSLEQHD